MANIFCEAAAEWDHDWDEQGVCRECGMGGSPLDSEEN